MKRTVVVASALLLIAGPAAAAPTIDGAAEKGAIRVGGEEPGNETPGDTVPVGNVSSVVRFAMPACTGNSPNTGVNEMCVEAGAACEDPAVMFQAWQAQAGTAVGSPGWQPLGLPYCTTEPAAAEPAPVLTLAEFRLLPLPAGSSAVEPPGRYVLVNMPTNVFTTTTEPTILTTTVLGVPVQVRATPERWSWDFGDGTVVGPTSDPGAAYPALTNTHEYSARGTYDIVMTTYYSGEFSLDGATWYPIQGETQVDSAPATVQALAGSNVLVAEP